MYPTKLSSAENGIPSAVVCPKVLLWVVSIYTLQKALSKISIQFALPYLIFCATEINKNTRNQIFSELPPSVFHFPYFFFRLWYPFCGSLRRSSAVSICHRESGQLRSSLPNSIGQYRSGSNLKSRSTSCCHILGSSGRLILSTSQLISSWMVSIFRRNSSAVRFPRTYSSLQPCILIPLVVLPIVHR